MIGYKFLGPPKHFQKTMTFRKKMSLRLQHVPIDLPLKKRKEEDPSITEGIEDGNTQVKMVKAQRPHTISPGTVTLPPSLSLAVYNVGTI